jgi:hypothetical protein
MPKTFGKAKKLVSLNPDKYKYLPLNMLVDSYGRYCISVGVSYELLRLKGKLECKSFKEWLRSEI